MSFKVLKSYRSNKFIYTNQNLIKNNIIKKYISRSIQIQTNNTASSGKSKTFRERKTNEKCLVII